MSSPHGYPCGASLADLCRISSSPYKSRTHLVHLFVGSSRRTDQCCKYRLLYCKYRIHYIIITYPVLVWPFENQYCRFSYYSCWGSLKIIYLSTRALPTRKSNLSRDEFRLLPHLLRCEETNKYIAYMLQCSVGKFVILMLDVFLLSNIFIVAIYLSPFRTASPSLGRMCPVNILNMVVFPAPFTPSRPKHCTQTNYRTTIDQHTYYWTTDLHTSMHRKQKNLDRNSSRVKQKVTINSKQLLHHVMYFVISWAFFHFFLPLKLLCKRNSNFCIKCWSSITSPFGMPRQSLLTATIRPSTLW